MLRGMMEVRQNESRDIGQLLFSANLELAGRFSPLVTRFQDFGSRLKVILCAGEIETSIIRSVRSKYLISPRVRYKPL
jgi:hypothetical protein